MDTLETQEDVISNFGEALMLLNRLSAKEILSQTSARLGTVEAIEAIVIPCLERMGDRFEDGDLSLSQIYMAGRICDEIVNDLLPDRDATGTHNQKIAIAVLEDQHSLGKKIVCLTLRSAGFDLVDFGVGLSSDELVKSTLKNEIDMLLISVLMLPSALKIVEVRKALDASTHGRNVKILVGGAPFRYDTDLWREVGADAVANNASEAIDAISVLTGERN